MANINFFYSQYATQFMAIDEDTSGLFCTIPSESNGESYTVRCAEHKDHVEVESCQCPGFRYHGHCKHQTIVQQWWNRIYKSSIVKASEKALEQAMDASDEQEAVYEEVAFVEQLVTTIEDQTTSTVKIAQPVATSSNPLREWCDGKISTQELVNRTGKIDGHSVRTLTFFGSLSSHKKPAA